MQTICRRPSGQACRQWCASYRQNSPFACIRPAYRSGLIKVAPDAKPSQSHTIRADTCSLNGNSMYGSVITARSYSDFASQYDKAMHQHSTHEAVRMLCRSLLQLIRASWRGRRGCRWSSYTIMPGSRANALSSVVRLKPHMPLLHHAFDAACAAAAQAEHVKRPSGAALDTGAGLATAPTKAWQHGQQPFAEIHMILFVP